MITSGATHSYSVPPTAATHQDCERTARSGNGGEAGGACEPWWVAGTARRLGEESGHAPSRPSATGPGQPVQAKVLDPMWLDGCCCGPGRMPGASRRTRGCRSRSGPAPRCRPLSTLTELARACRSVVARAPVDDLGAALDVAVGRLGDAACLVGREERLEHQRRNGNNRSKRNRGNHCHTTSKTHSRAPMSITREPTSTSRGRSSRNSRLPAHPTPRATPCQTGGSVSSR